MLVSQYSQCWASSPMKLEPPWTELPHKVRHSSSVETRPLTKRQLHPTDVKYLVRMSKSASPVVEFGGDIRLVMY